MYTFWFQVADKWLLWKFYTLNVRIIAIGNGVNTLLAVYKYTAWWLVRSAAEAEIIFSTVVLGKTYNWPLWWLVFVCLTFATGNFFHKFLYKVRIFGCNWASFECKDPSDWLKSHRKSCYNLFYKWLSGESHIMQCFRKDYSSLIHWGCIWVFLEFNGSIFCCRLNKNECCIWLSWNFPLK